MAITRVQVNGFSATAASGTIGVSLTGIATGAAIVGVVSNDDGGAGRNVTGVTDDLAVAGVISHQWDDAAGFAQNYAHYSFKNHGGGSRTFTAAFSASTGFRFITAIELAGAEQTGTLNGPATHGSGTSAAPSSGAVTPAIDGAYFLGHAEGQTAIPTPASPFALVWDDSNTTQNVEDYVQPAAASRAATWTMVSAFWSALVSTYYPAALVPGLVPGNPAMAIQQRAA